MLQELRVLALLTVAMVPQLAIYDEASTISVQSRLGVVAQMKRFAELKWSIVPGPKTLPAAVFPSAQVRSETATYAPAQVAQVLTGLSGMVLETDGDGDWWSWRASYEGQRDLFEVNMTLYETDPPLWGGSELVGITDAQEALDFWTKVVVQLPHTYLHGSDARLYSMEGFRRLL